MSQKVILENYVSKIIPPTFQIMTYNNKMYVDILVPIPPFVLELDVKSFFVKLYMPYIMIYDQTMQILE